MKHFILTLLMFICASIGNAQDTLYFKDGRIVPVHLVSVTTEHTFFTMPTDSLTVTRIGNTGLEKIVLAPNSQIKIDTFSPNPNKSATDPKKKLERKVIIWTVVLTTLIIGTYLIVESVNNMDYTN